MQILRILQIVILGILFFLTMVQIYFQIFSPRRRKNGWRRTLIYCGLMFVIFLIPSLAAAPVSPDSVTISKSAAPVSPDSVTISKSAAHVPDWLVYYNQTDERWANELYGEVDYMEEAGCGPTVLAMAVSSLTDTQVSPKEMADWAAENGYCAPGSGSYHTLIADGLKHFGLECATTNNGAEVQKALKAGYPVIALMGEGHFTGGGHFLLLCNIDARGEVFVADPKSVENTEKLWPLDTILAEAKTSPTTNGAYWIIRQQV